MRIVVIRTSVVHFRMQQVLTDCFFNILRIALTSRQVLTLCKGNHNPPIIKAVWHFLTFGCRTNCPRKHHILETCIMPMTVKF